MSKPEMIMMIVKLMKCASYATVLLVYNFVLGVTSATK